MAGCSPDEPALSPFDDLASGVSLFERGPQGPAGPAGQKGKELLSGSGAPSASTGVDGDHYLDKDSNTLYGPKANGAWGAGTSLGGGTDTGANVGTGEAGVYKAKVGSEHRFRTVKAGTNVTVTQNADDITIDAAAGSATVADDIGKSGPTDIDRVLGFRGKALNGDPTESDQVYVYDAAADDYKPGRPHIGVRKMQKVHVDAFGAVADCDPNGASGNGTDNATAFENAIKALTGGADYYAGIVELSNTPGTAYRLSRPVKVTRGVVIRGQGGAQTFAGTTIAVDSGRTGFILYQSTAGGDADGATDATFEDLNVVALGRNTNSQTGTYTVGSEVVTLDAAGDFINDQLIALEGRGAPITLPHVKAQTTSGSAVVTITADDSDQWPVFAGSGDGREHTQYLIIGDAFPTPTAVVSWDTNTGALTMASNAATTGTLKEVKHCPPVIARIVSGGGTTTLTTDTTRPDGTSGTCVVKHADAAFDVGRRSFFTRVCVGDTLGGGGNYFQGPAWAIRGHSGNSPATNANSCNLWQCESINNRHAVYLLGNNANASTINVMASVSKDFSFCDLSLIGNLFLGCHADGGFGYIALGSNSASYIACYAEGGTQAYTPNAGILLGGTMPIFAGGTGFASGYWNGAAIGKTDVTRHAIDFVPHDAFFRLRTSTGAHGGGGYALVAYDGSSGGDLGFVQWVHWNLNRTHPIVMADTDQSAFRVGSLWFPNGFMLGEDWGDAGKTLDDSKARRFVSYDTSALGYVYEDPDYGQYDSGTNLTGTRVWKKGDFIRDIAITDGSPTKHVTVDGHRAQEWAAATSYPNGSIVAPTPDNHSGFLYINNGGTFTSGASEPTWPTGVGATVGDNGGTWTRTTTTAAMIQPVELDGYRKRAISGDETWAQTDRQFLVGSIEITGTLSANATITLPVGRYKRWFWNNTTGGYSLLIKCASGNTVTIAAGKRAEVQCTGTEMRRRSRDTDESSTEASGSAFKGRTVIAMADTNQTLNQAQSQVPLIKATGALTAPRTLTLYHPSSEAESYMVGIRHAGTGQNITIRTGTGNEVDLSPGNKAVFEITPDGVYAEASYTIP